ncbi:MAG TPA: NUDIX domain-containing protein [Verrucomicrobiae bacterium]|nr:NUDIX domain-containing protein [Verrucomicrobiae bacterium]
MKSRVSAGLVLYRKRKDQLEIFLAHPGGPFFAHKDDGHWTIPKGEVEKDEDMLATAIREMQEETGIAIDKTQNFIALGSIRQKGGKIVHAWATEYTGPEPGTCKSNVFEMEWPMGSGRMQAFPEVDRAEFFALEAAKVKIKATQIPLLDRLAEQIGQGQK